MGQRIAKAKAKKHLWVDIKTLYKVKKKTQLTQN